MRGSRRATASRGLCGLRGWPIGLPIGSPIRSPIPPNSPCTKRQQACLTFHFLALLVRSSSHQSKNPNACLYPSADLSIQPSTSCPPSTHGISNHLPRSRTYPRFHQPSEQNSARRKGKDSRTNHPIKATFHCSDLVR
jgi:hypothetical protein